MNDDTVIQDSFLRSIVEKADDDAPRLIYADWLEEHSDAGRAEFIRIQCESARLHAQVREWASVPGGIEYSGKVGETFARAQQLDRRSNELLAQRSDKDTWIPRSLVPHIGIVGVTEFHRGFVELATLHIASWLEHGQQFVNETPLRIARLVCKSPIGIVNKRLSELFYEKEVGENPVNRLHTLDISGIRHLDRWGFFRMLTRFYRPWPGLRCLILPPWENQPVPREAIVKRVKDLIPSLEEVHIGRPAGQAERR